MRIDRSQSPSNPAMEMALELHGILYTIPVHQYPKKSPILPTWGKGPLTTKEIRRFFKPNCGIAVVCGEQSQGLHILDIECEEAKDDFEKLCYRAGKSDLVESLYRVRTPGGGFHYGFRCKKGFKTQVLATNRAEMEGAKSNGLVIELRGEGSYVLMPPSKGYRQMHCSPFTIPIIEDDEAELLLDLCKSLSGNPQSPSIFQSLSARRTNMAPFAKTELEKNFELHCDYREFLAQCGWEECGETGHHVYWTRPGKDGGVSAASGYGPSRNCFMSFSTSVEEFTPNVLYSKLETFANLFCEGDKWEALRMWREESLDHAQTGYQEASFMNGWMFDE